MKRKLLCLATALMQLVSIDVAAQTTSQLVLELGDPLIWDASQITSNASDRDEGQDLGALIDDNKDTFWHSDWHKEVTDPHYLQFELLSPLSEGNLVIYIQRRNIDGNHLKSAVVTASEDGETWETLSTEELGNAYGHGEFVSAPIPVKKPYTYIRLTNNPSADDNIFFHAAEIELYNPTERMYTCSILNSYLVKYDTYYWDETGEALNMGTGFGQHADYDTWHAFVGKLDEVMGYFNNPDGENFPSIAEANAIGTQLDSLYQKIMDSEVLFSLPKTEGYYRIIANLPYYVDEVVGKDENNQDIVERKYVTKAMFCSLEERGSWGTLQEDKANFLWKLTQKGDSIDMVNAGMEMRFSTFGSVVKMSAESDVHVIMDWAGNEDGRDIIYIRPTTGERNGSNYLHMSSHSRGAQTEDKILCTWKGTFTMGEPYSSDKGTSEWYLEPVSDDEAAQLIANFAMVKNHDLLVEQNSKLRKEVAQELEVAKDLTLKPLITSPDQMSSPFSQNDLGNRDGGDLSEGVLLDGNRGTYWHSVWSQGTPERGSHYIQIADMEEMVGDVKLYVGRRQVDAGHVTELQLRGSNDPDADDEDWTVIATLPLGNQTNGGEYTTPVFNVGDTPYTCIRAYGTQNTYWHISELQIYRLLDNPNSQFNALGEVAVALENEYLRNTGIADEDLTPEDYNALEVAFLAFRAGVVDPTELRNALALYANAAKGNVEGTEPGFWGNSDAKEAFYNLYFEVNAYNTAGKYNADQNRIYANALAAAAETLGKGANGVATDTWYRLKFPSMDLYTENNWDTGNVEYSDLGVSLYDTYATVGEKVTEGDDLLDICDKQTTDMREGDALYFLEGDFVQNEDAGLFRFIKAENPADTLFDFSGLLAKAGRAMEINTKYTTGYNLITDVRQLSSNASDRSEGQYIENLIDGDANSFWHSDWHGDATSTHYLQIALTQPITDPIQVTTTRRRDSDGGNIVRMFVVGSTDGQNWSNIGYVNLPFTQRNETVTSNPVKLNGAYTYLRFYLTKRSGDDTEYIPGGDTWSYFHAAEFQVRTVKMTADNAPALTQAYTRANAILSNEVTRADYETLLAAYERTAQEVNAAGKFILPEIEKPETYIIQNKANGLFVHTNARNNENVTMQLMPTFYQFSAIGYGECLLHGMNIDGTDCTNLHAQLHDQRLVTWEASTAGTNSGLMLETAGKVDGTQFSFVKDIHEGEVNALCYPVALHNLSDAVAYSVAGHFVGNDGCTYLALNATTDIQAAQPFLFILGNPDNYVAESDVESQSFSFSLDNASDLQLQAADADGLNGTFRQKTLSEADIFFSGNEAICVKDSEQAIDACKAYLSLSDCPIVIEDGNYDLCLLIDDAANDFDGVKDVTNALSKVAVPGAIFSLDGRLLQARGTLSDLRKLGRGTYILNGMKVTVK